ncbi:ribonuclease H [Olea europaea subsp. europaea]|uniref:Ribonuclease H n=1 Tax=Olea europaea subsp. europaea TaxID=158383 RepID=A0A8S0PVQ9_OLEEU|nr:ribonuclease H [Olea europaea subsp. europaea]
MSLQVEYGLGFKQQHRPKLMQYAKPLFGCLKLNIDGCFRGSLAVDGGVLRNANGDVVFAFHEFYDESCSNILETELCTLLTALKLCFENDNFFKFNIWAELDFIVGARCVEGRTDKSLSVESLHILDEIKFSCHRFQVGFTHIYREGNDTMDHMALQGFYTTGSLPVDGGVLRDANGDVVFAFYEFYDESCSNILELELHALLKDLKLCFENGYLFKFSIWAKLDF